MKKKEVWKKEVRVQQTKQKRDFAGVLNNNKCECGVNLDLTINQPPNYHKQTQLHV